MKTISVENLCKHLHENLEAANVEAIKVETGDPKKAVVLVSNYEYAAMVYAIEESPLRFLAERHLFLTSQDKLKQ